MSIKNDHQRQHRTTRKAIAAEIERLNAALETARDLGREAFKAEPELLLISVGQASARIFPDDKDAQIAYLQGYIEARSQHDAFRRGE